MLTKIRAYRELPPRPFPQEHPSLFHFTVEMKVKAEALIVDSRLLVFKLTRWPEVLHIDTVSEAYGPKSARLRKETVDERRDLFSPVTYAD
jgi:hypothetical protein